MTRGAVYWHFKNKADLFLAVRAETGRLLKLERTGLGDALQRLERGLLEALRRLEDDAEARASYEVMLWKCEYVGEFSAVRDDLMGAGAAFLADARHLYEEAKVTKLLPLWLEPEVAALETLCFYTGLLKIWLADPTGKLFRRQAAAAITQHVRSRRAGTLRSASAKRS